MLSVGYPLLSLPSGSAGAGSRRRILAPIAFIPVNVVVNRGANPSISIECSGTGADLVVPNDALIAWLEQQQKAQPEEFFADIEGEQPWREIACLVRHVAKAVNVAVPKLFETPDRENWQPELSGFALQAAPKADEETAPAILSTAVLGLYPMSNQGLIRDTKALVAGEELIDPARSFVKVGLGLGESSAPAAESEIKAPAEPVKAPKSFQDERLVTTADPCQAKAVRLARTCRGLVIHGPPGTGKSQTITNIIGDHLSRGQRVLMVCDKRTALDVVYHRLTHLGLASLCAVVHDPQRDQRNFYKSVRAQIDELVDAKAFPEAEKTLRQADEELSRLHAELTAHRAALMDRPSDTEMSVHELIGAWLELPEPPIRMDENAGALSLQQFTTLLVPLAELFKRAARVGYPKNPWTSAAGISLADFLKLPMADVRQAMSSAAAASKADETIHPSIPDFTPQSPVIEQGQFRAQLADQLENAIGRVAADVRAYWANQDARAVHSARQKITDSQAMLDRLRAKRMDTELAVAARSHVPMIATVAQQIMTLDTYLQFARKWHAFLHFMQNKLAAQVLVSYGLTLSPDSAERLRTFLAELRERLILSQVYYDVSAQPPSLPLLPDEQLDRSIGDHTLVLDLLAHIDEAPALAPLRAAVCKALTDADHARQLLEGLRASPQRAAAIAEVQTAILASRVLSQSAIARINEAMFTGQPVAPALAALSNSIDTLEGVIRVSEGLAALPKSLQSAARQLIDISTESDSAVAALRKSVLAGEISRRLGAAPILHAMDTHHIQEVFERYRLLSRSKRSLVRDAILHHWTTLQRDRLLAMTRTRLNTLGAEVKRRFMLNGEKAMRLRKVIELGAKTEGGDPLLDLRPVWLASPETVAQIFPRRNIFDVVIFDEASQCRLEEALPVLIRAKRVVIAGDQKQLPPTRFFESAAVASDEKEAETDQELFESQQAETEDLLLAALNMEIQESYLDVHYRSRNADLIEFSNQNFYSSRLQAIPGHPKNRTRFAPLTLDHVPGVYEKGENPVEAERVAQIVRELLKRANPPSIGIACFNVVQRDLILEKLDDLVASDSEFAQRYAAARARQGAGSFEGLFVKNLENVQGDERDHIIISTTYGPDAKGKFYRRFGPLGSAGGGRRLNVLVTRAREEVHLVTSIPRGEYQSLPPAPPGTVPTGGWLLFRYLQFAEALVGMYEEAHQIFEQTAAAPIASSEVQDPPTASPFAVAAREAISASAKPRQHRELGQPRFLHRSGDAAPQARGRCHDRPALRCVAVCRRGGSGGVGPFPHGNP